MALQIWTAVSLVWLASAGVLAGSAFLEARFADAVRLEQHAKDLRSAGIDPATVDWTLPVVVRGYLVPPAQLQAPDFWAREGGFYIRLAGSLPVGTLVLIEAVAGLCSRRRRFAGKPLVFPGLAGSVKACSMVPASAPPSAP